MTNICFRYLKRWHVCMVMGKGPHVWSLSIHVKESFAGDEGVICVY